MSWHGQLGNANSSYRAGKKMGELIDLEVFIEAPGKTIWLLEKKILVENIRLERQQHMGDDLKS